jgi:GT2 family glycosyltransferase
MDAGVLQLHGITDETGFDRAFRDELQHRPAPGLTHAAAVTRLQRASLIIPTFLNQQLKNGILARLLNDIQDSQAIVEVVLVRATLNGHADSPEVQLEAAITEQLQAAGKVVRWVDAEPNRRGASRNRGVAVATGELLVFLDDDMLLTGWRLVDVVVSRLLEGDFEAAMFPPRHYVRFPRMFANGGLDETVGEWRQSPLRVNREHVFDPVAEGVKFQTMGFCFPGCFMVIRRDAYAAVGGFADFEGWGFEDTFMAIEAARRIRILNLFRICEPLLHVDHPVTPYKSWEFGTNRGRYFRRQSAEHTAELHRRVLSGVNLAPQKSTLQATAPDDLVAQLVALGLPAGISLALPTLRRIADARAIDGMVSDPAFVVLTGSRGRGTSHAASDFDLLLLYRHGYVREFVVTNGQGADRVDIELADLGKFETLANAPAAFGYTGVLELSKLAGTKLLLGQAAPLRAWTHAVLSSALRTGRAYWMLFLYGLTLQPGKLSDTRSLMISSLRQIIAHIGGSRADRDVKLLDAFESPGPSAAIPGLIALLDSEVREWRNDMSRGNRVFVNQVPEIWLALHRIWPAATGR